MRQFLLAPYRDHAVLNSPDTHCRPTRVACDLFSRRLGTQALASMHVHLEPDNEDNARIRRLPSL
jgi:hypothetical protein